MIKENKPQFEVGDTVRVSVRIKEGDKERIRLSRAPLLLKKHGGIAETLTVRRTSYGVGVERVFPVNSPFVEGRRRSPRQGPPCEAVLPARAHRQRLPRSRHVSEHTEKREDGWRSPFSFL